CELDLRAGCLVPYRLADVERGIIESVHPLVPGAHHTGSHDSEQAPNMVVSGTLHAVFRTAVLDLHPGPAAGNAQSQRWIEFARRWNVDQFYSGGTSGGHVRGENFAVVTGASSHVSA